MVVSWLSFVSVVCNPYVEDRYMLKAIYETLTLLCREGAGLIWASKFFFCLAAVMWLIMSAAVAMYPAIIAVKIQTRPPAAIALLIMEAKKIVRSKGVNIFHFGNAT